MFTRPVEATSKRNTFYPSDKAKRDDFAARIDAGRPPAKARPRLSPMQAMARVVARTDEPAVDIRSCGCADHAAAPTRPMPTSLVAAASASIQPTIPPPNSPSRTGRLSPSLVAALSELAATGEDNIEFVLAAKAVVTAYVSSRAPESADRMSPALDNAILSLAYAVQADPGDLWMRRVTHKAVMVIALVAKEVQ